jgi:hypothetical protein
MRTRDTFDVMCSTAAIVADAAAVFLGFLLAVWIRFDTGWIPLRHDALPPRSMYIFGALIGSLLFLFIFRSLGLYARPQISTFRGLSAPAGSESSSPSSSHSPRRRIPRSRA